MSRPARPTAAGGILIALGAIGGAATGFVRHQPTVWLLAGMAIGIAAAILVWVLDRR